MSAIEFTLNGKKLRVRDVSTHLTLLDFLRDQGMTGSKEGCAEGECGACAVAMVRKNAHGKTSYEPMNSCLVLLASVADRELVTVEGIGSPDELHPVQKAMVDKAGSQCGYCTPGFVVSLFSEYYRNGRDGFDPESIGGNLCRCTGYRPILEAGRAMSSPAAGDPFAARLAQPVSELRALDYESEGHRYLRPTSLAEATKMLVRYPKAKLIHGGTDLMVEANLRHTRESVFISLEALRELQVLEWTDEHLEIGAGVSLSHLEERLSGKLPILNDLFPLFSSRLIRNRATLGGNLGNASPIGDSPPALLALDARLCLVSAEGFRWVEVSDFFTGYRETLLQPGELIASVRVPRPFPKFNRFYKVSKRMIDDISTVAAGFSLNLDEAGLVTSIRLAYGGVAATPVRAKAIEDAFIGKPWTQATIDGQRDALKQAFSPMSDHRGSDGYRREMVHRLVDRFFADTTGKAKVRLAVTGAPA